ncbi:MAG TPA: aminotransferase class IV, partial [Spirochaetia bacterium]|nr:aminotransferase class IV [Spirochaetia bacterium]
MGFTLSVYPWVYIGKYNDGGSWSEDFVERPHRTPDEEAHLSKEELDAVLAQRNSFPELPLVNYTTQYGLGCFEGLKAFPQKTGGLKLFRPDQNAARFARSMKGLKMPVFPEANFTDAVRTIVGRNAKIGFAPSYETAWEKDDFESGHSVYVRPFTYSEPAIGLGLSLLPWVVMVTTPVGAYFRPGNSKAVTTDKVRAYPGGTGWIKCDANYVTPILVKKQAEVDGYMEAIFLDAKEGKYVEEGSSCNIFFFLKSGKLVTPELGDTILPGITRDSILTIAEDLGIPTETRRISIDEAMSESSEAFVTGTAAGATSIESITHKGKTAVFTAGTSGETTRLIQRSLKGIQYGASEDKHGWMI